MTNQTIFAAETSKARLLFVVVPDGCERPYLFNDKRSPYISYFTNHETGRIYLPHEGYWRLLGDLKEVTEEQAASVVDEKIIGSNRIVYNHYLKGHYWTILATESLQSLARSLGIPEDKKTIVLVEFKK